MDIYFKCQNIYKIKNVGLFINQFKNLKKINKHIFCLATNIKKNRQKTSGEKKIPSNAYFQCVLVR